MARISYVDFDDIDGSDFHERFALKTSRSAVSDIEPEIPSLDNVLASVAKRLLGDLSRDKVMTRKGQLQYNGQATFVQDALLDTGASSSNYIGEAQVSKFYGIEREPCHHPVQLGDGRTKVICTEMVTLDVALYASDGTLQEPISTVFHILPHLGERMIIGLPDILGSYYDIFTTILEEARLRRPKARVERLAQLYDKCKAELCKETRNDKLLKAYSSEARAIGSWYAKLKHRVTSDPQAVTTFSADPTSGTTFGIVHSAKYGSVLGSRSVEDMCSIIEDLKNFPIDTIVDAWTKPPEECPEELDTPEPLAFGPDVLHFMETSVEEARDEYHALIETQVTPEMRAAQPRVIDILTSPEAYKTFAPTEWNGLKIEPVSFNIAGGMPPSMVTKARAIRPDLYQHAKKEFDRLVQYFYESDRQKCTSPIASPLVIAPKATAPFIRFCGDYRRINEYISIPQHPIPVVAHELAKASQFKVFVDLDMTNSFHQIPLSEQASQLLSVQTPWGLVRPKFLPEGVGPASGLLQSIVRDIFNYEDFQDWTSVIFDNFLVLADSYEDAANKLERVIARCAEFGVILKMKKSFIGASKVTFFGYEVTHGEWKLSQSRKDAIQAMPFPKSKKEMQSFLGAALFFHNHIPDYSEWSAKLYETTHDGFSWDRSKWTFDYEAHFEKFKTCIQNATELYFPRYDLPWIVRCDASEHAVGAILFQVFTAEDGTVTNQPIAFSSKRFSEPAQKWDAYKREAYAIFHSVHSFAWYLRGKDFLVETDHRNLQWIEASHSPIVCRWRALLQSFDFKIRHIPGRENKVADWLSRPDNSTPNVTDPRNDPISGSPKNGPISGSPKNGPISGSPKNGPISGNISAISPNGGNSNQTNTIPTPAAITQQQRSLDSILREVHGGRQLHYGAVRTWELAKELYPDLDIPISAVRDWVQQCPMCQKQRNTGIKPLRSRTLSLKPPTYRRTVGIDHVAVTPTDKHGNNCAIMIVEHFSHFPFVYAAKDYTAETVAIALFKHYCHHGTFEQLASDPGSAFMSEVVQHLNKWLRISHKVSLVGRHESNGTEGSNKQFLRHLRTLVMDERLYDSWSDDTVLPLINLHLASYPTAETGGYTPLQLKYGTEDARYFNLPEDLSLEPGVRASRLVKQLDDNLQLIRKLSLELQSKLVAERAAKDKNISKYSKGDFVLFNPREKPSDHLATKLSPIWLGPYEVMSQTNNDITVRHVVLHSTTVLHVDRVKPFFGTREDAITLARHDQHQYEIVSFNYYTGNPFVRTSMVFNITFEDGTIDMPYGGDFIFSQQFEQYCLAQPDLFPLRYTAKDSLQKIKQMERLAITDFSPNMDAFVNLRIYDGRTSTWFDSLNLPDKEKTYIAPIRITKWYSSNHRMLEAVVPIFGPRHAKYTLYLTNYDLMAYIFTNQPQMSILLEQQDLIRFPAILQS